MRALTTLVAKDLRLLWRDRAGLVFLLLAPLLVITVAGFSLANLYGADPTGQTAYDFPLVDEDGGQLGATIRARLADERGVRVEVVTRQRLPSNWLAAVPAARANDPGGTDGLRTVVRIDAVAHAPRVLEAVAASGGDLLEFRVVRPSLQDVFLDLTGRELRD